MNIAAAVLLTLCGAFIGFYKSYSLKKRTELLSESIRLCEDIEIKMRFGSEELDDIFNYLAESGGYKVFPFPLQNEMTGRKAEWIKAVKNAAYAEKPDKEQLKSLFLKLGETDLCGQLSLLEYSKLQLKKLLSEAEKTYSEKGRLLRSAGLLCGLACGVVIL